ncbi:YlbL family protein [Marinitenerispora sediminis]|uniref:PDZ/DHR/GLGF domain-containing protein n=1 Tax=Marinitenerispora sediminis TaxID=1931232 RepID=A0A368T5Y7_9ACTN|nr:PDZ domain-containing protein [Marinitenerispora sediminis]RCV50488.1 PDZ/DHR/GLGF domain-containing protein [Marinitenerispora sediminis]RCV55469.1 PDZ/DHR/GLGF domain-containing protein [Marinitenerispora sediminis]RCV59101.1 PDZ/DHR/GLGF domain-containing protein [Marinitenerispora sediminis]
MFRRAMTLIVAAALLVGLAVGGMFLPVPYLVASPGLALNTLGERDGDRIIQIDGHESYEHDGGLSMVTVQYVGGPGARLDLFTALSAWLSPTQAVLPEEAIFPPDRSVEEISETQTLQMDDSQQAAVAAALGELEIDYERRAVVAGVSEGLPAEGRLEAGDVILEVDGAAVVGKEEAVRAIRDREPGDPVELTVERDGETERIPLDSTDLEGQAAVGALIGDDLTFPFDVHISVGDVGGPSAGLMFALGVMDHLSPDGLTGGHQIAGTGTITADGVVGGVSGVEQKMVSAQRQGAEYFFVAADSCPQTFDSAATGEIEVVAVEELDDAVAALDAIRTGEGLDELPRCS